MKSTRFVSRMCLLCVLLVMAAASQAATEKTVYGWVEKAQLVPWGVTLKAKLARASTGSDPHGQARSGIHRL